MQGVRGESSAQFSIPSGGAMLLPGDQALSYAKVFLAAATPSRTDSLPVAGRAPFGDIRGAPAAASRGCSESGASGLSRFDGG